MIQIYTDGEITYDSRLEDYTLVGLTVTTAIDRAGTASIIMPPGHPAYSSYTSYRSVVEIYRDDALLFRGRALYPSDDFFNRRTIVCEGERCFLRDGTLRPYVYQDTPENIFTNLISTYNAQVDAFKGFSVGAVTVTDPNDYVRLESETAETFAAVLDKLLERVGGYIVFTTNNAGERVINWYGDLAYASTQVIEFGENLIDFSRSSTNPDLATVIIPYGARDDTTGERVTIAGVNDGLDYLADADAIALRGTIERAVYWDDITEPLNLLAKAQQYLASAKLMITSLELSAVDLSDLDKNIDTFEAGDTIRVRSTPHNVDEDFRLTERTYDLLNPSNGKVVLGKNVATLTGADAAGDRRSLTAVQRAEQTIKSGYTIDSTSALEEMRQTLTSLIQQASDEIRLEVEETYSTSTEVDSRISTTFQQLADQINVTFETVQAAVDENDASARTQFETIRSFIRLEDGNIIVGEEGNEIVLRIENDRLVIMDDGAEVAYLSNKKLFVTDGHFLQSLRVGSFAFVPRANGNLSLMKVVE